MIGSPPFAVLSTDLDTRVQRPPLVNSLLKPAHSLEHAHEAEADGREPVLHSRHEIGLRHHHMKKNRTDGAPSTDTAPFP